MFATSFCHFYNLVKNLPLFIPVVSALCHCFLGSTDTSQFFIEATIDKIVHLSQFFITPRLTINNCSFGLLLQSVSFFFFSFTIPYRHTLSKYLQSLYIHKPVYSFLLRMIACTLFPRSVTISVTILLSLFCSFVWPAFLRFDQPCEFPFDFLLPTGMKCYRTVMQTVDAHLYQHSFF